MSVLSDYPWIAEAFPDSREDSGGRYASAPCPLRCHRNASLRFWVGEENRLIFKCWADCSKLEILRAVGRTWKDCFPGNQIPERVKRDMTARYPYHDESGALLYEVCRFEPGFRGRDKDLRPRHCVQDGWVWGLPKEIRRVLYRLPELISADTARTVFVVAGEKDVDNLARVGVVATTSVFGERSEWRAEYSVFLRNRPVVIVPDQDSAGSRHANEVAGSLITNGAGSVRVAPLPAKDTTAFLNGLRMRGITEPDDLKRELWQAIQCSPKWAPSKSASTVSNAVATPRHAASALTATTAPA